MLNRPFSSINTNIFDEKSQNSVPATVCGQNVLVAQEQHQKVYNTLTTSIAGMPGYSGHYPLMQQNCPNAVTFTFNPNQPFPTQQGYWQSPPAMQNLNQLQQMNAVDLMALQRQLNEPYRCRFHLDNQTSTSDLTKGNVVRPDLSNLAGILRSKWPYWLQAPMTRNHKKLILRNVTAKVEGNVYDDLEKENAPKRVNFDIGTTKDADCQVQLGCGCCQSQNEDPPPQTSPRTPKKGKKSRKKTAKTSEWSSDDNFDDDK